MLLSVFIPFQKKCSCSILSVASLPRWPLAPHWDMMSKWNSKLRALGVIHIALLVSRQSTLVCPTKFGGGAVVDWEYLSVSMFGPLMCCAGVCSYSLHTMALTWRSLIFLYPLIHLFNISANTFSSTGICSIWNWNLDKNMAQSWTFDNTCW